ncbi:ufm1-specific protease 1 [Chanos chanos]|uniref:Ufm1-specific protease 1 n=1 Tax=Chanos chanos TaxID=29144 RepID=A0A6J2W0D0_CHACN|nr:inactive Ufm1-specific protease 1 [Chanos chanos]
MDSVENCEEIDWGGGGEQMTSLNKKWVESLVRNAHEGLPKPVLECTRCSLVKGDFLYYHYGCDGQDDRGWGCGYRTVQTISSWLCHNWSPPKSSCRSPPSLPEIQRALVTIGDKPPLFCGSKDWIGTFEAAIVLDHFYDVPCRIVHVRSGGSELAKAAEDLHQHFTIHGSPVMMGGDRDNSSKGILGVCTGKQGSYLLVMDPHYYGSPLDKASVQRLGWVSWKQVGCLDQSSFYNLCLPQTAKK